MLKFSRCGERPEILPFLQSSDAINDAGLWATIQQQDFKTFSMLYSICSFSLQLDHKLLLACTSIPATNIYKKVESISENCGAQPSENSLHHKSNKKTGKNFIKNFSNTLEINQSLEAIWGTCIPPTKNGIILLRTVSFVTF